jgi:hypothetical protein
MRLAVLAALFLLGGCAHTSYRLPDIPCDPPCPEGRSCDLAIGECRADACYGGCQRWERCVGTDNKAHCESVPPTEGPTPSSPH